MPAVPAVVQIPGIQQQSGLKRCCKEPAERQRLVQREPDIEASGRNTPCGQLREMSLQQLQHQFAPLAQLAAQHCQMLLVIAPIKPSCGGEL
ncbi:hypothetical protein D3C75_1257370 [compost metagenome]